MFLGSISETSRWPVPVSVISDCTITGATPRCFGVADELTHLPLVLYICANELDPGQWVSIGSGNAWLPVGRQAITQSHPD